ncbi:MAG: DsbA family oxidoreductase [Alphaproteobacteria bacterium]|nr:DsbA family oxidoreductase [Alphaproteobacteria bacterium]
MKIDIISDTVCPWCFIGKRRLEEAMAQRPDIAFEVNWRPYQLDPGVPREGMDRRDYMRAKFGDGERVKGMSETIREVGREAGIAFAFEKQERRPNTIDSHRVVHWAGSVGLQDAAVEALFRAYFEEGRDIGDAAVLGDIAAACGMDRELVEELLASDADRELVLSEAGLAGRMGVQGVPAFVFEGKYAIVGAQDAAVLVRVIDKVLEKEAAAG